MADTLEYTGVLQHGYGKNSRYRLHRIIKVNGVSSQETWEPPNIEDLEGDRLYRINDARRLRLDLIANHFYGDQHLWWVIAYANGIVDPFLELNPTSTPIFLKIPSPRDVMNRIVG